MKEKIQKLIKRFKELQGDPASIARGVAIGTFLGFAPLLPLKSILILFSTMVVPSSTVAAFLTTTVICNPLTYVPLYYLAWFIGNLILPGRASWTVLSSTLQRIVEVGFSESLSLIFGVGFDAGLVILVGGLLLAVIPALISYPVALICFTNIQKKRYRKHIVEDAKQ